MARGFLSGVLWGSVLSVGLGAAVSVVSPLPHSPAVSDAAPNAVAAPALEVAGAGETAQGDSAPNAGTGSAQVPAPAPDAGVTLDPGAQTPAQRPVTGATSALDSPAAADGNGAVAVQGDDPVLPNPQALAPMAPPETDNLAINTAPSEPAQPLADTTGQTGARAPQITAAPAVPKTSTSSPAVPGTNPEAPDAPSADLALGDPGNPAAPKPAPKPAPVAVAEPSVDQPASDPTRPSIGKPAISLTERNGGVTINRGPAPAPAADPAATADQASAPVATEDNRPALERNSVAFENPEQKPLMAIVLIDDGTAPTNGAAGIAALRSFPYPLSFAVNATAPDAADRIALYRNQGFEVALQVDLPTAATSGDAETILATALNRLTGVVAVLEGSDTGLQGSKPLSDQVTAILAQTGHGLVTQDKGLNTMPKLARKAGVPADPVFRDFDSKGQSATVIRRFLDQAAFKAGQEGAVIMLGRLRPDTITALLLWGLQDRAGQVALAPISAVLLRE
jgi:polysaccharide deacetylase 2 family uncharacterized protein YibQ